MRRILIGLFITTFVLSIISCAKQKKGSDQKSTEPPNVIFILVDDMGYGDLSFYGQKTLSTPNIDRMATEGMYFTRMYTGSTVCAPSRASLMTGKDTGHTSVRGNLPAQLLRDDELTLAKEFKKAGYVTGGIGKWGIGHPPPPDDPQKKGFDYFYGYLNMWHAHNMYPEFLYENGKKVPLKNKTIRINGKNPWADAPEGTGVAAVRKEYTQNLFDDKALQFIENNKDNKFFLYMAYNVPHANDEAGTYKGDGMEVPDYYEFANKDWPQPEKGFAAMIRNIDKSVEKILDKVKEVGLDENTMIIFSSDNGPHQEGNHTMEFFNSNREYRGMKRDLYEGGIKTPFIVRWPGVVKAGSNSDETLAFWDVLPTFADLLNEEKPKETDGFSFLPTLLGEKQTQKHDYLYWEFFEQGGKQAILKGDWKAIRLNVRGDKSKIIFELYNIKNDPEETNNVAAEHPDLVKEFSKLFISAREEFSVTPLFSVDDKKVETPF